MTTLIKSIIITESYGYGPGPRNLQGKITFANDRGEIAVNLDATKIAKLVAVLADLLVETAQDTAQLMVSDVLDQAKAQSLPAPTPAPFVDA